VHHALVAALPSQGIRRRAGRMVGVQFVAVLFGHHRLAFAQQQLA
jgi:hypothetical protein